MIAVTPVRPPACTPDALSMYAVVDDVPSIEPARIAVLSASSARFRRSILPSTSSPARLATPISVPVASNSSTRKNTSTTFSTPVDSAARMSSWNSVGEIDGGAETMPWNWLPPKKKLSTVTPTMPIRIAPRTRRWSSVTIAKKPIIARIDVRLVQVAERHAAWPGCRPPRRLPSAK